MKLFATRKRKSSIEPEEPRKVFQSDPVVEELLKQDPASWNAKQRRMIQRYQERNAGAVKDATTEPQPNVEATSDSVDQEQVNSNDDVSENDVKDEKDETGEEKPKETVPSNSNENNCDNNKNDEELNKLLEKLSSKQRRTLSRLLERTGDAAAVKVEALKMLEEKEPAKSDNNEPVVTDEPPSKRRRRRSANWDDLSPEERMRREEQKRLQKEAAERRARGETSNQHRHPLNSERRRANRRKPKFDKKKTKPSNEHNTSGFSVRKKSFKS